jgi:FMN-dependent NADH-azoreductase
MRLPDTESPRTSNILLVTSSPRGEVSHSSQVARALVDHLRVLDPSSTLTIRDLAREPLPHIDANFVEGRMVPSAKRSPAQHASMALSDRLVQEVLEANVLVIGSGMINFGIASSLKAWIDHLVRPGLTFSFSGAGVPQGLVTGKTVYLVEASGGVYSEGGRTHFDFHDPYLRTVLGFIGLTDAHVLRVEGVGLGPDAAEKAVARALDSVPVLAAARNGNLFAAHVL